MILNKKDRETFLEAGRMVSVGGRWYVDLDALETLVSEREKEEKAKAESSPSSSAPRKRGEEQG